MGNPALEEAEEEDEEDEEEEEDSSNDRAWGWMGTAC